MRSWIPVMFRVVSISLVLVVLVFARFTHSNNRTRSMILFQRVRAIFFCGWGTFCSVHCFYISCFLRKKSQRTAANFMCFTSSQHHDSHHRRRRRHHHHHSDDDHHHHRSSHPQSSFIIIIHSHIFLYDFLIASVLFFFGSYGRLVSMPSAIQTWDKNPAQKWFVVKSCVFDHMKTKNYNQNEGLKNWNLAWKCTCSHACDLAPTIERWWVPNNKNQQMEKKWF